MNLYKSLTVFGIHYFNSNQCLALLAIDIALKQFYGNLDMDLDALVINCPSISSRFWNCRCPSETSRRSILPNCDAGRKHTETCAANLLPECTAPAQSWPLSLPADRTCSRNPPSSWSQRTSSTALRTTRERKRTKRKARRIKKRARKTLRLTQPIRTSHRRSSLYPANHRHC